MNIKAHEAPPGMSRVSSPGAHRDRESTISDLPGDPGLLEGGLRVAGLGVYSTLSLHPGLDALLF